MKNLVVSEFVVGSSEQEFICKKSQIAKRESNLNFNEIFAKKNRQIHLNVNFSFLVFLCEVDFSFLFHRKRFNSSFANQTQTFSIFVIRI